MKNLYLICFLFIFGGVSAQDMKGTLEAKLSIVQDPEDQCRYMAIGISFINHTDKDIYLPGINNISGGQSSGGLISMYEKKEGTYIKIPLYPDVPEGIDNSRILGNPIPSASSLASTLNLASKTIKDERLSEVKKMILNGKLGIDTIFFAYDNLPLFLKSGEEHTYYYTVDIRHLARNGQFKFVYEAKLTGNEGPIFPDELVGYQKYIPVTLISNPVYIDYVTIKPKQ